jgi:hypothetical protein
MEIPGVGAHARYLGGRPDRNIIVAWPDRESRFLAGGAKWAGVRRIHCMNEPPETVLHF